MAIRSSTGTASTSTTQRALRQRRVMLQGGVSAGRQTMDNCDVVTKVDNPSTYQCHRESALLPQVKLLGTYPLPWWGLQVSGTFQSQRARSGGRRQLRLQLLRHAGELRGRQRAGGAVARPQPVVGARTSRSTSSSRERSIPERTNQFDLRVAKTFMIGDIAAAGHARLLQRVQLERGAQTEWRVWFRRRRVGPARRRSFPDAW